MKRTQLLATFLVAAMMMHSASASLETFKRLYFTDSDAATTTEVNRLSVLNSGNYLIVGETTEGGFVSIYDPSAAEISSTKLFFLEEESCYNYTGGSITNDTTNVYIAYDCKTDAGAYYVNVSKLDGSLDMVESVQFTHEEFTSKGHLFAEFLDDNIVIAFDLQGSTYAQAIVAVDSDLATSYELLVADQASGDQPVIDTFGKSPSGELIMLGHTADSTALYVEVSAIGTVTQTREISLPAYDTSDDEEQSVTGKYAVQTAAGVTYLSVAQNDPGNDSVYYIKLDSTGAQTASWELDSAGSSLMSAFGEFDSTRYYLVSGNLSNDSVLGFPTMTSPTEADLEYNRYESYYINNVEVVGETELLVSGRFEKNGSLDYGWFALYNTEIGNDDYYSTYYRDLTTVSEVSVGSNDTNSGYFTSTVDGDTDGSDSALTRSTSTKQLSPSTGYTVEGVSSDDSVVESGSQVSVAFGSFVVALMAYIF